MNWVRPFQRRIQLSVLPAKWLPEVQKTAFLRKACLGTNQRIVSAEWTNYLLCGTNKLNYRVWNFVFILAALCNSLFSVVFWLVKLGCVVFISGGGGWNKFTKKHLKNRWNNFLPTCPACGPWKINVAWRRSQASHENIRASQAVLFIEVFSTWLQLFFICYIRKPMVSRSLHCLQYTNRAWVYFTW